MKKILLGLLFTSSIILGQETTTETIKYTSKNKSKIFIYWGWNRASYTDSDITFTGKDYDFTLYDVKAHDKPKGVHIDYINPTRVTIPQTDFRIGYFVTDKYKISFGLDHMKYVMTQYQDVKISGDINISGFEHNSVTDGNTKTITPNFLAFEHTDGLNYVNVEVTRFDDITPHIFKSLNTDKLQINFLNGLGIGGLYPRTNTTLMNKARYDEFHWSGYGSSIKTGLNITFFKHFFIQTELKGGYIFMPDIRTTMDPADRASQDFFFFQRNFLIGGIFKI